MYTTFTEGYFLSSVFHINMRFETKYCIDYHSSPVRMQAEQKKYIVPGKFAKQCSTVCLPAKAYVARETETKFYCREREREALATNFQHKIVARGVFPPPLDIPVTNPTSSPQSFVYDEN